MNSIGASSRSPSPMTMVPSIGTVSMHLRMVSTAAWSDSAPVPKPHRVRAGDGRLLDDAEELEGEVGVHRIT